MTRHPQARSVGSCLFLADVISRLLLASTFQPPPLPGVLPFLLQPSLRLLPRPVFQPPTLPQPDEPLLTQLTLRPLPGPVFLPQASYLRKLQTY